VRNLILFVQQYRNFFVFLLLEIICLAIVFRNNDYQQSSYLNSSRQVAGSLYARKHRLTRYLHLGTVNDSLARENARLRGLLGVQHLPNPLHDTAFTRTTTTDSNVRTSHYNYIPVRVLNNTVDQKVNYITLEAGSKQGIQRNMAVINEQGIVGRISHVSPNYSVALSMLSERFNVSAMVPDGTVGTVSWDGQDPEFVNLRGIPQSVKLKPLDSVFTSGYSYFPERVFIGRVARAVNGGMYKIWLHSRFHRLHYVYVVAESSSMERIQLEQKAQEEQ
jgi:rod shape-determining protein MreC